MNARILVPLSSALFLCIGVFAGYLVFRNGPEDELVIVSKPAEGNPPPTEKGALEPLLPAAAVAPDGALIEKLKVENAELAAELESVKAALEETRTSAKRARESVGPAGRTSEPAPVVPQIPRPSLRNVSDLREGKGGMEGYFIFPNGGAGANISVTLMKHTGQFKSLMARTDTTGRFEKMNLTPGRYHVSVGMIPRAKSKWPHRFVEVTAGEITRVDFGRAGNIRVRGKALSEDGKPITNAMLLLMPSDLARGGDTQSYSAMTDDTGGFSFENLEPAEYRWCLQGLGQVSYGCGKVAFTQAGPFEWDIRQKGTKISGQVRGRDSGSPIGDATVSASQEGDLGSPRSHASTESDGRFLLTGLPKGRYAIRVFADGYVVKALEPMELAEGQALEGIEIVLDPAAVFRVKVKDETGQPITDVDIYLFGSNEKGDSHHWPLHLMKSGVCVVPHFPSGRYKLEVTAEGYASATKSGVLLSLGDDPTLEFILKRE
jgi:hypothetical protein